MEVEKKRAFGWDDYFIQPWVYLFFSFNSQAAGFDLPLRVVLWNGRHIDLGTFDRPKITMHIKGLERALASAPSESGEEL
ncbi:hypothetical protein M3Y99_00783700 [Aphelenchoides fujianensis]|nr:hypothetical protein M3Y99_00783700 [Aphelenchoides fujianensis]